MQTHYVFIDYENTQPGNMALLTQRQEKIKVKIFLGRHQNMIPFALVRAMHALGEDAEYIQLDSTRRNTIDFNIAFQLGELAIQHPEACFSILSNDPGYKPIMEGLKSKGVSCVRFADIESLIAYANAHLLAEQEVKTKDKVVTMMEVVNKSQNTPPGRRLN